MIAGTSGNDTCTSLLIRKPSDAGVSAAKFERASTLQMLGLEPDWTASYRGEVPAGEKRSYLSDALELGCRR